jgi:hypothetical protein
MGTQRARERIDTGSKRGALRGGGRAAERPGGAAARVGLQLRHRCRSQPGRRLLRAAAMGTLRARERCGGGSQRGALRGGAVRWSGPASPQLASAAAAASLPLAAQLTPPSSGGGGQAARARASGALRGGGGAAERPGVAAARIGLQLRHRCSSQPGRRLLRAAAMGTCCASGARSSCQLLLGLGAFAPLQPTATHCNPADSVLPMAAGHGFDVRLAA